MRFVGYIETGGKSFGVYEAEAGIIVQKSNYSSHTSEGRQTFTKEQFVNFLYSINTRPNDLDPKIQSLL